MTQHILKIGAAAWISFTSITLPAQVQPVKENLLKLLELLPAPCGGINEAFTKCGDASGCSSDKVTAAFDQAFKAKSMARATGAGTMNASHEALMKKMEDPAFQEEVKKMSQEQLMALSVQLQGGGLPTAGIPTPEETAMAEEFERINQDMMDFLMKYNNEWSQLLNAFEERKRAIENARSEELKKCPTETSGEMTFTSPACCAVVEKKYDAQWRTAAEEWVPKANDVVAHYRAAIVARYTEAEKRMAALGYGDKCHIQMFLDMVTDTQSAILGSVEAVSVMAGQVWQVACENHVGIDREMICP